MPDSDHRSPLTLEDLLHLKRAERPSPEFWTRFEVELRQKQLAALIDRRPWWQTLPQLLVQRRAILPLGATALLAFGLVSIRYQVSEAEIPVGFENTGAVIASAQIAIEPSSGPAITQFDTSLVAAVDLPSIPVRVADAPLSANLPERASELTPWSAPRQAESRAAHMFTANVEQTDRTEPGLVKTLVNNFVTSSTNRVQRSGGAVAELASVSALASKRTRLLAQFGDRQFAPEPQAPALVRERLARRLADATSASDHFSRVGLKGDQVSLRF